MSEIHMNVVPGWDDAVALALALASDGLEVVGVTTTAGNSTVENAVRNESGARRQRPRSRCRRRERRHRHPGTARMAVDVDGDAFRDIVGDLLLAHAYQGDDP